MKNTKPNDGLIREPFPGDQKKPIGKSWKPLIFIIPPFPIAGLCWLFGLRGIFGMVMVTLLCSTVLTALLYYLYFAETDYFFGNLRDLWNRRK
jgi:hypothetical protein